MDSTPTVKFERVVVSKVPTKIPRFRDKTESKIRAVIFESSLSPFLIFGPHLRVESVETRRY